MTISDQISLAILCSQIIVLAIQFRLGVSVGVRVSTQLAYMGFWLGRISTGLW